MFASILAFLSGLVQAIPIFNRWFTKTEVEKESSGKADVDQEHQDNAETRRPSGDFWKDHHP